MFKSIESHARYAILKGEIQSNERTLQGQRKVIHQHIVDACAKMGLEKDNYVVCRPTDPDSRRFFKIIQVKVQHTVGDTDYNVIVECRLILEKKTDGTIAVGKFMHLREDDDYETIDFDNIPIF